MKKYLLGACVLALAVMVQRPAWADSVVTLTPVSPHPQQIVTLAATGFGASEAVDVYIDTTDTLLLVSTATGTLSASITVPASATPGTHYVTAIGRKSGDAAQVAFTVTTPWMQFGYGNAHLGWNPYENTLNSGNAAALGQLWSVDTDAAFSTPVVSGGQVFIGTVAGVESISAATGAQSWIKNTSESFYASPTLSNSMLYIGAYSDDFFYALHTSNGSLKWTQTLGSGVASAATVSGGIVYIGCNDYKIYALNASTGAILWTYTTGGQVRSSPTVVGGMVYAGSFDGKVYALNATTGALVWSYTTGGPIYDSPAVANGAVYIGSGDHKLYALGAGSGVLLWSVTTGSVIYGSPAVANGMVVVGSEDAMVYALNTRTGATIWTLATGGLVDGTPGIANGVIYIGTAINQFLAIDLKYGAIVGSAVTTTPVVGGPAISDGAVYVNGEFGNTNAYTLNAGVDSNLARIHAPNPAFLRPNRTLKAEKAADR
jgi:outer membrane protein assembly factor BamB